LFYFMKWNLKVSEPSGENRVFPLNGSTTLGRGSDCQVILRDPTIAPQAALLWAADVQQASSPFWIRVPQTTQPIRLGDLMIREANLPVGIPFQLGDTQLTIESEKDQPLLPLFPTGVRPWLTCSENGRQALWTAKKAAATPLSLYLAGETGTGKEVLAHLIHAWSPRKSGPFVPIHCGALPISLAESELFGHVKGAFTGAVHHRPGALMQAHGGTLFLDEIGDLPLDIQVKLLRFLENGEIRPIGADRTSRADVRLVCATHHPLQKLVAEGKFRQDLFYRLASVTIDLPTLRSRPDDIEMLAVKFAHELERILSPRSLLRLQAHAWPGNVRELRHAIERASGLYDPFTSILGEDAFQFLLTPENIGQSPDLELGSSVLSLHEMERVVLLKALKLSRGNRAQAAKILGVARSTLFEMLKRHRIAGPRSRVGPKHH
jgi:transcriptional regulator with PAS, ATPase and Fis domain